MQLDTSLPLTVAQADDASMQLLEEMVAIAREELGMTEREATPIAHAFVRGMRKRYGGMRIGGRGHIYIPAPSKSERNEAIRRDFDGSNGGEVMKRYGIKRSQLYNILDQGKPGAAKIGVSSAKSPVSPHETGRRKA
ncbi:MAG: hypothetical protein EOP24_26715 [Hyphomicrobiales bacterium]|nr:MAG: hypothetical protein EOP24_26715 [Hyphomicrobiales bacterium]